MLIWDKYYREPFRRKSWLHFACFSAQVGVRLYISISFRVSLGTRRSCSKESILNLCWWSAQIPHYSHGCIVTGFLIYYCLLYLNIKYLGKWGALVCTIMAHTTAAADVKDALGVRINPSSWLPIIIDQSVRGESARPVQGQYNYCSMASTSRQSTGQSNCISHS